MRNADAVTGCDSDAADSDSRQQQIQQILTAVARRLDLGEAIQQEDVEQQHPGLMPELGGQLRVLLAARELACEAAGEREADLARAQEDAELELLREGLEGYEVQERIRSGGQGCVYRARQAGTGRTVAIKVILEGPWATLRQRSRFAREIELVARLRHPNIVAVHDCGVVKGRNYYVMEFVEGDQIDDFAAVKDLAPREIVRLIIKVCDAVHHAHLNGVLHRDLNPANILVTPEGEPRVYDFGLAKDLWTEDASVTGVGCGTLPYLSPEQAGADDGRADVRTDVHALGLILYELLADMLPYPVQGDAATVRRTILETEPRPIRQALAEYKSGWAAGRESVDRDLEMVLTKAVAPRKADRYQTVADFAADLERWLAGAAVAARAGHRLYVVRKALWRHRVVASFAAGLLIALGVGAAGVVHYWLQARAQRDVARTAANKAYDLFDLALTNIEEEMRPLPGGVAARDRLVTLLAQQFPALEELAHAGVGLDRIRLSLLEKCGDLAKQQGDTPQAEQYYGDFLRALELVSDPDASRQASRLRAYRKLAAVSRERAQLLDEGIRLGETFAGGSGLDEAGRLELCWLLQDSASLHFAGGNSRRALDQCNRTLELCPRDSHAPDRAWAMLKSKTFQMRSNCEAQLAVGDWEADIRESTRICEELLEHFPADVECRHILLKRLSGWGFALWRNKRLDEALTYLTQAAAQGALLAQLDPASTEYLNDRQIVHDTLSRVYFDQKNLEQAVLECQTGLELVQQWAAVAGEADARAALYRALRARGWIARRTGDLATAHAVGSKAVEVAKEIVGRDPHSARTCSDLAGAYDDVAYVHREQQNWESAIQFGQLALDQVRWMFDAPDCPVDFVLSAIQSSTNLAFSHVGRGAVADLDAATALFDAAAAHLDRLQAANRLLASASKVDYLRREIRDGYAQIQLIRDPVGPPAPGQVVQDGGATGTSAGSCVPFTSGSPAPDSVKE